jgi:hypothetical protein
MILHALPRERPIVRLRFLLLAWLERWRGIENEGTEPVDRDWM